MCKIENDKQVGGERTGSVRLRVFIYYIIIYAEKTSKMDSLEKAANYLDEELFDSTADPNISVSVMAEDVPKLTVATIVGVTVVMLVAIIAVFLLGVLIDCRQQRLLEEKMGIAKRLRHKRRTNTHPVESDTSGIANNMEEPSMSLPPAEVLRHIP